MPPPKDPEKYKLWKKHIDESAAKRRGIPLPQSTRDKMGKSHKGQPSFWKGKTFSQSTCDKMSKSRMGRKTWNKGIPSSKETCEKQSKSLKGKPKSIEARKHMSGENHPKWRGGITALDHAIRELPEMYVWKTTILKRDDYKDCFTGIRGNHNLEVHHIKSIAVIMNEYNIVKIEDAINCKELWDVKNGITMFKKSHIEHHRKYGLKILPREYYFKTKE